MFEQPVLERAFLRYLKLMLIELKSNPAEDRAEIVQDFSDKLHFSRMGHLMRPTPSVVAPMLSIADFLAKEPSLLGEAIDVALIAHSFSPEGSHEENRSRARCFKYVNQVAQSTPLKINHNLKKIIRRAPEGSALESGAIDAWVNYIVHNCPKEQARTYSGRMQRDSEAPLCSHQIKAQDTMKRLYKELGIAQPQGPQRPLIERLQIKAPGFQQEQ